MKTIFILGILCLVALASAGKQEKYKDYQHHNVKKYEKDAEYHHHKRHRTPEPVDSKKYVKWDHETKKEKHVSKNGPHDVPPVEAELQANLAASHKQLKTQHDRHQHEDIHLQDLTYEEPKKVENQEEKKKHQDHQKNHHKNAQHSFKHKNSKEGKIAEKGEEKLFLDQNTKEHVPKSHPVLEDAFEPLNDETVHQEEVSKKHSKKPKYKKAHEKSKKDKHHKKSKKEKKHKKDKKTW